MDLRGRWDQLVAEIENEMQQRGQDVSVLEHKYADRKIRLPLPGLEWFAVSIDDEQIASDDLGQLARKIYEAYRAAN